MEEINIYKYHKYYKMITLSDDEKAQILNQVDEEFPGLIRVDVDGNLYEKGIYYGRNRESFWGCHPTLANLKFIFDSEYLPFDGSKTDLLCKHIYGQKYTLAKAQRDANHALSDW